jgi:hypothetical protein
MCGERCEQYAFFTISGHLTESRRALEAAVR